MANVNDLMMDTAGEKQRADALRAQEQQLEARTFEERQRLDAQLAMQRQLDDQKAAEAKRMEEQRLADEKKKEGPDLFDRMASFAERTLIGAFVLDGAKDLAQAMGGPGMAAKMSAAPVAENSPGVVGSLTGLGLPSGALKQSRDAGMERTGPSLFGMT